MIKWSLEAPRILYDDFVNSDNWLYYTVRFQNLGTFPATFVRIEDELDSQLDETSFQMLQSSHDYVVKRTLSSLEWFFDDINLFLTMVKSTYGAVWLFFISTRSFYYYPRFS